MDTKNKIRTFIKTNLLVFGDEALFEDSDDIYKMGFVNSLFAMKLLNYIEGEFNITVENDELKLSNFNSVNNIEGFVETKLAGYAR